MKTVLRILAILVVSCALGLAVYTVVQPTSPSVSFAPEGKAAMAGGALDAAAGSGAQGDIAQLQGASGDNAASAQAFRGGRPQGAPDGGPGGHPRGGNGLSTVLLALGKFALAFLFIVIARFLVGKVSPKKAEAQA